MGNTPIRPFRDELVVNLLPGQEEGSYGKKGNKKRGREEEEEYPAGTRKSTRISKKVSAWTRGAHFDHW